MQRIEGMIPFKEFIVLKLMYNILNCTRYKTIIIIELITEFQCSQQ